MSTYSPFVAALHVFIGGGAGAVLRWQLGRAMTGWLGAPIVTAFPFATLAANAAGSLLMGLYYTDPRPATGGGAWRLPRAASDNSQEGDGTTPERKSLGRGGGWGTLEMS